MVSEVEQVKTVANGRPVSWNISADRRVICRVWQVIAAAPRDRRQPELLVIWGRHDLSFDPGEPIYRRDVPKAEVHVLDAGHFALDIKADEIAALVRAFINKEVTSDK